MSAAFGVQMYDGALNRSLEMATATYAVLDKLGKVLVEESQAIVAVRTGYLQDHIQYYLDQRDPTTGQFTPWKMWFGDDAVYAAYVEYGTRNFEAEPYIRPVAYKYRNLAML